MTFFTRRRRLAQEVAATFVLALPIVAGQVLTVAMNTVDTVLAGRLGTQVLAAVSQGYQLWVVVLLLVIGCMLAVSPGVAQLDGAGRRDAVGALFRQALWLALVCGVLLMVGVRQAAPLLSLAGLPASILPDATAFLRAISWGAPALALFFACKNTSEGLSLSRPTMYFSLLGIAVLAPAAVVLMYGRLGLPALGAAGAGYAHALALWAQALGYLAWLAWRPAYRTAGLFERFDGPDPRAILGLLRIGVPMGMALFMEGGLFVVTALLVGSLGEVPAGAHAIAINVASLAFMVPLGLAMATTVRVGNAVGRRSASDIAWAGAAGLALVLASQLVSAGVMFGLPRTIAGLFSTDPPVVALAGSLLALAAIFQFSDGIQALANGALRGLKDTAVPAAITVLAYWGIGFPVGWWLGIEQGLGPTGLWMGLIAGLTVAAALLGARFVARVRSYRRHGVPALSDVPASAPH
jgi:MATE family multidrug resistance protein